MSRLKFPCMIMTALFLSSAGLVSAKELDLSIPVKTPFPAAEQKAELTELNGKKAIHLQWNAAKKKWAELYWTGNLTPPLHQFRNLKLRIAVQAGKTTRPIQLMPRFSDHNKEVFPLISKIKYDATGHGSAEFILSYDYKAGNSWTNTPGEKKNGKVDLPVRLTGLAVDFPAESGRGEVYITGISVEKEPLVNQKDLMKFQKMYPSPFQFDIITGHSVRVVVPGAEKYCYAVLFNSGGSQTKVKLELTLRDIDGNQIGGKIVCTDRIGKGSRRYYPVPVPRKFGIYYVDAEIESPGNPSFNRKITRSFAYMRPTGHTVPYKKGQFRFGVNTHWKQNPETWRIEAEACRMAGIRFIRDGFGIGSLYPRPGYWFFSYFDAVIDFYLAHGLQPELLLHGSAAWAARDQEEGKKMPHTNMPRLEIWQEFCKKVFQRYGNKIKSFEIWNEPDLKTFAAFSAAEYFQLAKIAYEMREKYAPQAELMSAGFCNFKEKDRFHEKAMKLCRDFFAVHCFHGHGSPIIFQQIITSELKPMRQRIGIEKMPWYAHETALTATGFGEKMQAEALFKKLVFAWAHGSIGYTWYDLRNDGFDPKNPEHNYGMLTNDYYPKAVYAAYNTLTGLLGGDASFEKELANDSGINAFRFRRDGEIVLFLWHDRKNNSSEITLETDAESAEIVDMWGNRQPVSNSGKQLTVTVANTVSTLVLKKAAQCEIGEGVLTPSAMHLYFREGRSTFLTMKCLNPFSEPIHLKLDVKCPSGIRVKPFPQIFLRPEERKNIRMEFSCDTAEMHPDSVIQIGYFSNGQKREMSIPATLIHTLRREFGSEPYAVMNRREQVVELFDADPGNVFRLWTGPGDLSAKLWLAANQKFFRLKVEVMDDRHRQPNRGTNIWKGDSVQVFCAFPGQKWVWQFGCALHDDNTVERFVWQPDNVFNKDIPAALDCKVARHGMLTVYQIQIPWSAFGIKPEVLKQGFGFNLMINESDSNIRESWLQLAPGVGSPISPERYPVLIFDNAVGKP